MQRDAVWPGCASHFIGSPHAGAPGSAPGGATGLQLLRTLQERGSNDGGLQSSGDEPMHGIVLFDDHEDEAGQAIGCGAVPPGRLDREWDSEALPDEFGPDPKRWTANHSRAQDVMQHPPCDLPVVAEDDAVLFGGREHRFAGGMKVGSRNPGTPRPFQNLGEHGIATARMSQVRTGYSSELEKIDDRAEECPDPTLCRLLEG